jgi:hypothetical protein
MQADPSELLTYFQTIKSLWLWELSRCGNSFFIILLNINKLDL